MKTILRLAILGFLLTLAVQLFVLMDRSIQDPLYQDPLLDAFENWRWASEFARGEAAPAVFQRGPLYLWLLAAWIRMFGESLSSVFFIQVVLASLTGGLAAGLATRVAGWLAGLLAALFFAFSPAALHFSGEILDSSLSAFLMLTLVALTEWARGKGWKLFPTAAAGLALGALALCRPNALALLIPLGIWSFAIRGNDIEGRRAALRGIVILLFSVGIAVSPATLWNRIVGKDNVLITASGGINLYLGNRRGGNGISANAPELGKSWWENGFQRVRELAEIAEGRPLKPSEVSSYWSRRAWSEVAADPMAWLRLMGWKLWVSFLNVEIPNNKAIGLSLRYSRLGRWPLPGFGVLLAGAIVAIVMGRLKSPVLSLTAALVGTWIVTMLLFIVNGRYRFTIIPCLTVLAGVGWAGLVQERRFWGRGLAAVAVGTLLASSGPIVRPKFFSARAEKEEGQNQLLLANHYRRGGDLSEEQASLLRAMVFLERAQTLAPEDADVARLLDEVSTRSRGK